MLSSQAANQFKSAQTSTSTPITPEQVLNMTPKYNSAQSTSASSFPSAQPTVSSTGTQPQTTTAAAANATTSKVSPAVAADIKQAANQAIDNAKAEAATETTTKSATDTTTDATEIKTVKKPIKQRITKWLKDRKFAIQNIGIWSACATTIYALYYSSLLVLEQIFAASPHWITWYTYWTAALFGVLALSCVRLTSNLMLRRVRTQRLVNLVHNTLQQQQTRILEAIGGNALHLAHQKGLCQISLLRHGVRERGDRSKQYSGWHIYWRPAKMQYQVQFLAYQATPQQLMAATPIKALQTPVAAVTEVKADATSPAADATPVATDAEEVDPLERDNCMSQLDTSSLGEPVAIGVLNAEVEEKMDGWSRITCLTLDVLYQQNVPSNAGSVRYLIESDGSRWSRNVTQRSRSEADKTISIK